MSFAPLSYNEGCAHSFDIMSVWKIMSSASLSLIKANNLPLEVLHWNWVPSMPAREKAIWNQDHWGTHSCGQYFFVTFVLWKLKKGNCIPSCKSEIPCPVPHCALSRQKNCHWKFWNSLTIDQSGNYNFEGSCSCWFLYVPYYHYGSYGSY